MRAMQLLLSVSGDLAARWLVGVGSKVEEVRLLDVETGMEIAPPVQLRLNPSKAAGGDDVQGVVEYRTAHGIEGFVAFSRTMLAQYTFVGVPAT